MIVDKDCKGRSAQIENKEVRRMVTKLRGGKAQLHIETGRWKGEGREERKCKECSGQEVEDAKHFLLKCDGQQLILCSDSVNFFVFLNSASWGAIPSACCVRCTCALKYT